jgi:hypothetical protein
VKGDSASNAFIRFPALSHTWIPSRSDEHCIDACGVFFTRYPHRPPKTRDPLVAHSKFRLALLILFFLAHFGPIIISSIPPCNCICILRFWLYLKNQTGTKEMHVGMGLGLNEKLGFGMAVRARGLLLFGLEYLSSIIFQIQPSRTAFLILLGSVPDVSYFLYVE